jgi:hypothetical protein
MRGLLLSRFVLLARDLAGAPQIAELPDHKANACANQNDHLNNFQHRDDLSTDSFALFQTPK